jgi:ABC-type polysaccharide/polyol phosphate export permease
MASEILTEASAQTDAGPLDQAGLAKTRATRRISAIDVPQSGPSISRYQVALSDIVAGVAAIEIWGRLGWKENKRRYRRTVFGPFWTTLSLAIFVTALGIVWSNLWKMDPQGYLPYLCSGMLAWVLFSTTCTEACSGIVGYGILIKQLRISYTLLACATVWRNVVVFIHNLIVYVVIFIYAGLSLSWAMLLVVPGFALLCLNALWITLLLGAVCARYRDIQQFVSNLLQISLFLTPIFWSPGQLSGRTAILVNVNPLYHLIAIVRDPLLGKAPDALSWIVTVFAALGGWILTAYLLAKIRHRIAYWI